MNDDRVQDLLALLLEGRLDESGQEELASHFEKEGAAAREAARLWIQDAQLRHALAGQISPEQRVSEILRMLRSDVPTSGGLAARVLGKIRSEERPSSPPLEKRRSTRRFRTPGGASTFPPYARLALPAAALLGGILLLWAWSGSKPPSDGAAGSRAAEAKSRSERIEAARRRQEAERRLEEIQKKRKELEESAPRKEGEGKEAEAERRQELERVRKIEEEMKAVVRSLPQPSPASEEPRSERETATSERQVAPLPRGMTESTLARLERLVGEGVVFTKDGPKAAAEGQELLSGQGFETTGPKSSAVFLYPDATRVELAANTEVKELKSDGGKRLFVAKGEVHAQVAKQPKDQAMVFATPHGEAKVLGTTLRLAVTAGAKGSTQLEVEEGKVELQRLADGKVVLVSSGHYAIAAPGVDLVARSGTGMIALSRGLVGRWTFDEGTGLIAADLSGRGHEGQLISKAGWARQGKVGGALQLDGVKSHVLVSRTPLLEPVALTVAFWIKRNGAQPANGGTLITKSGMNAGASHGSYGLQLVSSGKVNGDVVGFDTGYDGGYQSLRSPPNTVPDATWIHIAGVYDPSGASPQKRIYVSGVLVSSATETHPILYDPNDDLYFGGAVPFAREYYRGLLDDVRIYDRALSPEDLKVLVKVTDR